MKTMFSTLATVLVTLCTTSTALADTPAPVPADGSKISAPNVPQFYYSATSDESCAPEIEIPPSNADVFEGEVAVFSLKILGSPIPEVKVLFNGKQIDYSKQTPHNKPKYLVNYNDSFFILEIFEVDVYDMGAYEFVAKNDLGKAKTMVALKVTKREE